MADRRVFIWGLEVYTPSRFYQFMFDRLDIPSFLVRFANVAAFRNSKVFMWLFFVAGLLILGNDASSPLAPLQYVGI